MSEAPLFCLECGSAEPCGLHPGGAVVRAASSYSPLNRCLVHIMKYENGRDVALMMGELMATRFGRPCADVLVPVPLHKSSERDYNQAELIARGAAKVWRIKVAPALRWRRHVLSQALKSGTQTRRLPEDAITGTRDMSGERAFIVDDVCTSGNTIRASARALEELGAAVAGAMVWSRGMGRGDKRAGGNI
jgi:predicted amidophosphoribosyltransferase